MANDLFDEWASGISLANPASNDFFEEIPTELANPQNFTVSPDQIPENPVAAQTQDTPAPTVTPDPQPQPTPELQPEGPEVRKGKRGGSITLEKTSRGWRAT